MLLISAQLYLENPAQCKPQELVCIVPHAAFAFTLDHANAALCMSYQTQHLRVESYCATATLSSATVPSGQYAKYNGSSSQAICSVNANLATQNEDGWTTIVGKQKKNGSKTLDQEMEHERTNG